MKTDGIRMVSILAVLLLLSTGMASILMNDDSSAATYNYNGSKTVKVNESFSATVTGQQNLTNYIADASNFSMTGAPNGVEYKYQKTWHGQTYDDDVIFSGKVSTAGTYAIKVTLKHGNGITCVHTLNLTVTSPSYTHTINYNSNGGSGSMSASTVTDNESGYSSVQLKSNGFTKSGYHFTGWYVDGSYKSPGDYVSVRGNSSVTATAQWEQDVVYYTVSFNSNGGSSCSSQTVESGKSITLPSTSKSGYSFDGWYTSSSGGSYVGMNGSSYTVTSNVTLYAHWTANPVYYSHTIYYNSNGGSGSMSSTSTTNTTSGTTYLTLKSNEFTKSDYHFTGWKIGSTIYQPGQTVGVSGNSSVTAYAQWEQNTYTATLNFNANGGSGAPSSQTYTSTSTSSHTFTIPSTTPTRSGYEFRGWSESSSATSATYQPGSTISVSYNGTKTLYAVWAQTYTHTINYNSNGGSGSMSPTTKTDSSSSSSVPLANNGFTKTGYHFVGWKIGNTGTTYQPGQTVSVGTSVTAYAQWEQNTISLNAIDTQYAVVGKSVSFNAFASSDPSGASITFSKSNVPSGLSVSISGSTITCSSSTTGTFTFTLTASATNYQSDSKTVTVEFVPALAFTNSPLIGVIGS